MREWRGQRPRRPAGQRPALLKGVLPLADVKGPASMEAQVAAHKAKPNRGGDAAT